MEKLVRDRIAQRVLDEDGPACRRASEVEFPVLLAAKLVEEAREFQAAPTLAEMADVAEVMQALCEHYGWSPAALSQARRDKIACNGAFDRRFVLEVADVG
jgi:predicted house-cleaning noncanonical NTP pyrophosphatase (MazG superfamily)